MSILHRGFFQQSPSVLSHVANAFYRRDLRRDLRLRAWCFVVGIVVLAGMAPGARAHQLQPGHVISEIRSSPANDVFGIREVTRDPRLPRLLVIRVGPRWTTVPASERRSVAERWMAHWRETVAQGIVAIVDAATDRSLVNFDAEGRARLTDVPDITPAPRDP